MRAVGIGARPGTPADDIEAALADVDAEILATVDRRAGDAGIVEAARRRGWPIVSYPASVLATVSVPHPSTVVGAAVGTVSVAEAAALLAAGSDAVLVVPKKALARVTIAVADTATSPHSGAAALVG